jgi:Ca-activated chloride channel family protein
MAETQLRPGAAAREAPERRYRLLPARHWPQWLRTHFTIPSWLISALLHAVVLLILGATLEFQSYGQSEEYGREVGIVLKSSTDEADVYEDPAEPVEVAVPASPPQAVSETPPIDLAEALPSPDDQVLGLGAADLPDVSEMLRSPPVRVEPGGGGGGQTAVPFFGVKARGSKFVYVLDRSASMGTRNAIGVAKANLLASLQTLDETNQFQVIFYNLRYSMMPAGEGTGRFPFATAINKEWAHEFIKRIVPDSGTDHLPALKQALSLDPDVIFFLTDADEPKLRDRQLEEIRRRNRSGARIHSIEFGIGPPLGEETFLERLARMNGGSYDYVDVTTFGRTP